MVEIHLLPERMTELNTVIRFAITQTAPNSPLAPQAYMVGKTHNPPIHPGEYYDAGCTLEDALNILAPHLPTDTAFTIEYTPWRD